MAEIFPTPQSAVKAMTEVGWEVVDAVDYINAHDNPDFSGVLAALQAVQASSSDVGCTPTAVTVTRDDQGKYQLTGRMSGRAITQWAVADNSDPLHPVPLLLWIDADVEVHAEGDPRAQDRVHDGMPADPFGDDPGHAAVATDAIELKTMLDTYIDAGFTRAEAFELILAHHQTELDHQAQHCLVEHQHQYEQGGDQ